MNSPQSKNRKRKRKRKRKRTINLKTGQKSSSGLCKQPHSKPNSPDGPLRAYLDLEVVEITPDKPSVLIWGSQR